MENTGDYGGSDRADRILDDFAESWKRPPDFENKVRIVDEETERCEKKLITEMTAVETRDTRTTIPSEYADAQESRIPLADRYSTDDEEFLDEKVTFIGEPSQVKDCRKCEAEGEVKCPKCKSGIVRCGRCRGTGWADCENCRGFLSNGGVGRMQCPDCSGSGKRSSGDETFTCGTCAGDGHVMCNVCSGSGEHRCSNCGNKGTVTCGKCSGSTWVVCPDCKGETEFMTYEVGSVQFTTEENEEVVTETGVPERYLTYADGAVSTIEKESSDVEELETETIIKREVEHREIDTLRIDYEYGDESYSVWEVHGRIQASSYPKSTQRTVAPFIAGTILILVLIILAETQGISNVTPL